MTRFNSEDHLARYIEFGEFPSIHRPMVEAVQWACPDDARFLDLGACFGLLGAAVQTLRPKAVVIGVERSASAIELAQKYGLPCQLVRMHVSRETVTELAGLIRKFKLNTVIARRVLPELWGGDLEGGRMFAKTLRDAGIRQVLLEGRRPTGAPKSPLSTVELESAMLSPHFKVAGRPQGSTPIIVMEAS